MPEVKGGKPVVSFQESITVPVAVDNLLETIDSTIFKNIKWSIVVFDNVASKRVEHSLNAILLNSNVKFYEITNGDNVNCEFKVTKVSDDIKLLMTNNEANALNVDLLTTKY